MHLLCPHCHNPVELTEGTLSGEFTCPACGSGIRLTGASTEQLPRKTFGRFEILTSLGAGAFGVVYKARDPAMDRLVAVKVPRAGDLANAADLERFLREARSAAQLRHPAIVAIHEVGLADGLPFLVSEFVEGVTLSDLLSARRTTTGEAARLVAEAAEALHHAHEHGVVHRDVKPSNLMVTTGPDGVTHVRVMDFGLARRETGEVTMTVEGQVLGTPAYMPPEQARGEGHAVDARADVYSLGVVLYHLLTGELPFRGTTRMLLHQVLHDEPRSPRTLNDRIPRDLETVCLKAMAKDPARRYPTAEALADDLGRHLRGEAVLARPVGRAEKLWRWCRRNPALATTTGMTAATLVAIAAVTGLYAVQQSRAAVALAAKQEETDDALEEVKRRSRSLARQLAESQLDRGIELCRRQEVGTGLLWLARALRTVPEGEADLERVIRLNLDGWRREACLPVAWLPHVKDTCEIAFAPGGTAVLAKTAADAAQVLDAHTGQPAGEAIRPGGTVTCVAVGPDGRLLTGSSDGRVRLWDAATRQPAAEPFHHDKPVARARFSPDGKTVATLCAAPALHFWDAATGKRIGQPVGLTGTAADLVYRADQRVAAVMTSGNAAELLLAAPGATPERRVLPGGADLPVSADGERAFSAEERLKVLDVTSGGWVGPGLPLSDLHLQLCGADIVRGKQPTVAVGGAVGIPISVWEPTSGRKVREFAASQESHHYVRASPDGRSLLTSSDSTTLLWRVDSGKVQYHFPQRQDVVKAIDYSPDGNGIVVVQASGAWLWRPPVGPGASPVSIGGIGGIRFSPGGETLVSAAGRLRDVATFRPRGAALPVAAFAFSDDGEWLFGVPSSNRGVRRAWDARTARPLGPEQVSPADLDANSLQADGKLLGFVGSNQYQMFDFRSGLPVSAKMTVPEGNHGIGFAMDRQGRTVAIPYREGIVLYDTSTGSRLPPALQHAPEFSSPFMPMIVAAEFSPDGRRLATAGSADGTARVWDVATRQPSFPPLRHNHARVLAATYTPDGRLLVTTSRDRQVRFWDAATGVPEQPSLHLDLYVSFLKLSPNGKLMLTGEEQPGSNVQLWDVATRKAVGPPWRHAQTTRVGAFSPTGALAATAAPEWAEQNAGDQSSVGRTRLWHVPVALAGTPDEVERFVRVLTGTELTESGGVQSLDGAAWDGLRRNLLADPEPPLLRAHLEATRLDSTAWHWRQAGEAETEGNAVAEAWHLDRWVAVGPTDVQAFEDRAAAHAAAREWGKAIADYSRALELGSSDTDLWRRRAIAHVGLRQWDRAEADYAKAITLDPDDPSRWIDRARFRVGRRRYAEAGSDYDRALSFGRIDPSKEIVMEAAATHAAAKAAEPYRRFCTRLLERATGETNPYTRSTIAWECSLAPGGVADPKVLVPLAEAMVPAGKPAGRLVRYRLSLALYRAGRYQDALDQVQAVVRDKQPTTWGEWFVQAMCHARLKNPAEARKWLDKAVKATEAGDPTWSVLVRLEAELLRGEAEAVCKEP